MSSPLETRPKKGDVTRETTGRVVEASCRTCARTFEITGAAWSHSASARHVVDVRYAVAFTFRPNVPEDAA